MRLTEIMAARGESVPPAEAETSPPVPARPPRRDLRRLGRVSSAGCSGGGVGRDDRRRSALPSPLGGSRAGPRDRRRRLRRLGLGRCRSSRPATTSSCSTTCPPVIASAVPRTRAWRSGATRDWAEVRGPARAERIEAILHCAARSLVGESGQDPARYYRDNVAGGIALLEAAREAGVGRIVFSSTAAVYGVPDATPIPEDAPTPPDQHVRRDEADVRGGDGLVRQRLRAPVRHPPLLQRRRRHRAARRGSTTRRPT